MARARFVKATLVARDRGVAADAVVQFHGPSQAADGEPGSLLFLASRALTLFVRRPARRSFLSLTSHIRARRHAAERELRAGRSSQRQAADGEPGSLLFLASRALTLFARRPARRSFCPSRATSARGVTLPRGSFVLDGPLGVRLPTGSPALFSSWRLARRRRSFCFFADLLDGVFGPGPAISAISGEGSGVRSKPAFPVTRLVISRIAAPPSSRVNTDLRGDWNEPPSSRVHTGDRFSSSGSTSSRSSTRRSIRRPMDPRIPALKSVMSSQAQEYV